MIDHILQAVEKAGSAPYLRFGVLQLTALKLDPVNKALLRVETIIRISSYGSLPFQN